MTLTDVEGRIPVGAQVDVLAQARFETGFQDAVYGSGRRSVVEEYGGLNGFEAEVDGDTVPLVSPNFGAILAVAKALLLLFATM